MEAALQLRRTAGEPWEAKLSFCRSSGVKKLEICKKNNRFLQMCVFRLINSNFGGGFGRTKSVFSIVFLHGSVHFGQNNDSLQKAKNVEQVLCFTVLDAIS